MVRVARGGFPGVARRVRSYRRKGSFRTRKGIGCQTSEDVTAYALGYSLKSALGAAAATFLCEPSQGLLRHWRRWSPREIIVGLKTSKVADDLVAGSPMP